MLLERLLSSVGLEHERVYKTTVTKCRPPGLPPRSPKPSEVSSCRPYLVVQLAAVDPKVVVAMGDLASRVLTGRKEAVARIRGRAIPLRSEEHTSELQSRQYLVCRLLLEKKKKKTQQRQ